MEPASARLTTVVAVRCLGCGAVYAKPTGRSSLVAHNGCPECTYVGWRLSGELLTSSPRARSAADRPPPPQP
jgi:predicted  nucleic acid-binding Zn-ribbon protein